MPSRPRPPRLPRPASAARPRGGGARPVGRPREFDEDEVLDRAMTAFWDRGYEATSVADLVEATGIAKGSLYKAFGDKHALYLRALDRYLEAGRARIREALASGPDAAAGLAAWLDAMAGRCGARGGHRGCLAVNAAVELGPGDETVRRRVDRHFASVERLVAKTVAQGVADGSIRADVDPPAAAAHLMVVVSGLLARGRAASPPARVRRVVEHVMGGLRAAG